jgi:type II secretory pathway component GspD/PulD (secretin)
MTQKRLLGSCASLVALLQLTACGPTASAQQLRRTSDGGTILVSGAPGNPAAVRQAVSSIEQQCRGVYEVVELATVQTGQATSTGVAYSIGPIALGTSSSSPVYGTSITYLCRPPQSTALNESVIEMASADIVGRKCAKDGDCGPLFCVRAAPAAEYGACAGSH